MVGIHIQTMKKIVKFTLIMAICVPCVFAQENFPPSPTLFANTLELGDTQQAKKWLDEGLPIFFEGSRIGTGLHIAAWEGNLELIQLYLAYGAPVDLLNQHNETPLTLAAWRGQQKAVNFLIQNGAQINTPNLTWSPLHYAVFSGHKKMVQDLIQQGADVNAQSSNGSTALMMAIYEGRADLIETLLKAGADARIQNDRGEGALEWAMRKDRIDLARKIASPEELKAALSKPKTAWQPIQKSMASSATLEKLLKMREVLKARGQDVASIERRIAGERKAIIERDFDAGKPQKPQRVQTLEISAHKNAPEKQTMQFKTLPLEKPPKALPLDSSKRTGKPLPMPPKTQTLRNF